jgi:DNA-binding Lrp family transcriptional regulator
MNSPNRSVESVLRPHKFNKRGEGFARSGYYQYALAAIRNHHSSGNDPNVFNAALLELRSKAATADEKWRRVKRAKNADAIEAYRAIYGKRHFRVLTNHRIGYPIAQVIFTAQPDLWVFDEDEEVQVLLKIGIAKKRSSYVDVLLTVMRKAAVSSGYLKVRARNVVYLNVTTGKEMICESNLTRFNRTFAFIARTIALTWPNVTPPDTGRTGRKAHAASASG